MASLYHLSLYENTNTEHQRVTETMNNALKWTDRQCKHRYLRPLILRVLSDSSHRAPLQSILERNS